MEMDYLGALGAGLKALLIDRKGKIREKDIRKIRSLLEVVRYV